MCRYKLEPGDAAKEYEVLGKILGSKPSQNREDIFEHRVQFVNIYDEAREEIIRFIFETERKIRRKIKRYYKKWFQNLLEPFFCHHFGADKNC